MDDLADVQTLQNGIVFYTFHTQEVHNQVLRNNHVSVWLLSRIWLHWLVILVDAGSPDPMGSHSHMPEQTVDSFKSPILLLL